MTKHTEGPWVIAGMDENGHRIDSERGIVIVPHRLDLEESIATAELVARAPQLEKARLEILAELLEFTNRTTPISDTDPREVFGMMRRWSAILELAGPEVEPGATNGTEEAPTPEAKPQ